MLRFAELLDDIHRCMLLRSLSYHICICRCCCTGTIMRQTPLLGTAAPPLRRRIVAVVGDSNLDPISMKPQRVHGDEQRKQQLAEQVSSCWIVLLHCSKFEMCLCVATEQ
jgi:hypothetical protein